MAELERDAEDHARIDAHLSGSPPGAAVSFRALSTDPKVTELTMEKKKAVACEVR